MGITKSNETYSSISLSGGKDSTALLLLMLEKGMPIDSVLYANTTMEFPEMEAHIAKLDELLFHERGIHITTLQHLVLRGLHGAAVLHAVQDRGPR